MSNLLGNQEMKDHDLLVRLDENVKTILANQVVQSNNQIALETRVRTLENFRYFIAGGGAILGFLGGLVGSYILRKLN